MDVVTGSLEIEGRSCGLAAGMQQEPTRVKLPSLISAHENRRGEGKVCVIAGPCLREILAFRGRHSLVLWFAVNYGTFPPDGRIAAADGGG